MPSVMATIRVKEDKIEQAKGFFKELGGKIAANEPGTLAYVFHQKLGEPTTFIVYEKYESQEAFKTHGANLASEGAGFKAIMAGPPEILLMEEI